MALRPRGEASYGVATSTRTGRKVVVGIVAGCVSLVLAAGVPAAEAPPPGVEDLWEEYPLAPEESKPQPPPRPAPTATVPDAPVESPPAESPPAPDDERSGWMLAVAGAIGLVVLLGAAVLRARARRRAPAAWTIPDAPGEVLAYARALAIEAAECDMVALHRAGGSRGMTETVDHEAATPAVARGERTSYTDIGERVAGVLSAAEAAAEQIQADARSSAEGILSAARQDADEVRGKADTYDTDTRAAVDSYASELRRDAEQGVQKQLADGESQARATRQAAEAMARQIEEAGWKRGQALRDESKVVEERLKKALVGLRRMVVELEELVGGAAQQESLADALRPVGHRDSETERPASPRPHTG